MKDVGAVRVGRQRSPDRVSGRNDTPYLRAGNITADGLDLNDVLTMDFTREEREIYALQAGDVVLAEASGSPSHVGRAAVWRDQLPLCCFQNTVIRFRPHAVRPEYAHAVFRHYVASGIFAKAARGIALQHLGARRFAELTFPLPPLREQERIVEILDRQLDELRHARAALESALAGTSDQDKEILAAAATGRLMGMASTGASSPKAPATGLPERNPIPADWRWSTVGEVGELTIGKTLGPSARRGSQRRPYLRVANVLEDHIDFSDLKETEFSDEELDRFALRPEDILLNDGQSPELVGRAAMYHGELEQLYFQNHLIRFRAYEDVVPSYALIVFRHYLHSGEFRRIARGSTNIANLSRSRLAAMPFPVPPLMVQEKLVADAQRRLIGSTEQRRAIVASMTNAKRMAAELLSTAVSGRIVDQDPADEPAADLLKRLGPPPRDRASPARSTAGKRQDAALATAVELDIAGTLAAAGQPLTVAELARAAGVDVNDVAAMEELYIALHSRLGRSVAVVEGAGEDARVEAAPNAPG